MKKIIVDLAVIATAVGLLVGGVALAAPNANSSNKLQCFDGQPDYPGTCSISNGVATLNNSTGPYSGVYISGSNLSGRTLSQVANLSFNYTGTPTNGSPRMTLPIDMNGDGTTDDYLSISAYFCNNGAGIVDAINDSTCTIYRNGDGTNPVGQNWADLVANHPTWTVGPAGDLPFIIADDTGSWTVSNVHIGKAARTTGK